QVVTDCANGLISTKTCSMTRIKLPLYRWDSVIQVKVTREIYHREKSVLLRGTKRFSNSSPI
ncbi:uracil DNA glycosylase superfamily protein, partial [Vibrio parahaemolyticus V-223/04]